MVEPNEDHKELIEKRADSRKAKRKNYRNLIDKYFGSFPDFPEVYKKRISSNLK